MLFYQALPEEGPTVRIVGLTHRAVAGVLSRPPTAKAKQFPPRLGGHPCGHPSSGGGKSTRSAPCWAACFLASHWSAHSALLPCRAPGGSSLGRCGPATGCLHKRGQDTAHLQPNKSHLGKGTGSAVGTYLRGLAEMAPSVADGAGQAVGKQSPASLAGRVKSLWCAPG